MNYLERIISLSLHQRGQDFCKINLYTYPHWAKAPDGWEHLSDKEKYNHPDFIRLIAAMNLSSSQFERSQAWWVYQLGRTKEAHLEWWISEYSKDKQPQAEADLK